MVEGKRAIWSWSTFQNQLLSQSQRRAQPKAQTTTHCTLSACTQLISKAKPPTGYSSNTLHIWIRWVQYQFMSFRNDTAVLFVCCSFLPIASSSRDQVGSWVDLEAVSLPVFDASIPNSLCFCQLASQQRLRLS